MPRLPTYRLYRLQTIDYRLQVQAQAPATVGVIQAAGYKIQAMRPPKEATGGPNFEFAVDHPSVIEPFSGSRPVCAQLSRRTPKEVPSMETQYLHRRIRRRSTSVEEYSDE